MNSSFFKRFFPPGWVGVTTNPLFFTEAQPTPWPSSWTVWRKRCTHLPRRLRVVLGWHFEVVHAAVGALEGKEAAVFGSDLGGAKRAELTCEKCSANSKCAAFHPKTVWYFFFKGRLTEHWACSRDLQPCLLMLAAASDLRKRGDLVLFFYFRLLLYHKRPRSEEKMEIRSWMNETAPTVWSTRIKPRLAGRPSRSANQKILNSAGHQQKSLLNLIESQQFVQYWLHFLFKLASSNNEILIR